MGGRVEVGVALTGDSSGATRAIDTTTKSVEELDKTTEKAARRVRKNTKDADDGFSAMAKTAGHMAAAVAAAGVAIGGLILRKTFEATAAQDAAMAQLNATLKSTEFAAGKTADELSKTAASLQKVTAFGDEAVISAQSIILTFKNIKGDNFDRATKAVLDMSTALKIDLKSASILAGKALNDPIKGLSALSRSGVQFTDSQKEMITAMVEAGDTAKAQEVILRELESQFGGSAEAYRNTLGGALEGLKNAYGDLFEAEQKTSDSMVQSLNEIEKTLSSENVKSGMQELIAGLLRIIDLSAKAAAGLANLGRSIGEKLAKAVGGIAIDDRAGIEKRLAGLQSYLDQLAKSGQVAGPTVEKLKREIDELNKKLEINTALFGKSDVQVKKTTVTTKAHTVETEKQTTVLTRSVAMMAKAEKEQDKLNKRLEAATKITDKTGDELAAMVKKTEDYIDTIKFETEQLGKSERAQEIENTVRQAGTRITAEQERQIRAAAAARYDERTAIDDATRAQEEAANRTQAAWEDARSTLSGFFFEMAADGKDAFETLVDGFKAMLVKMVAEAAANQIILGIGTAAAGLGISGAASATTAAGGAAGGLLSNPVAAVAAVATVVLGSKLFGEKNDGKNRGLSDFDLSTGEISSRGSGKSFDQQNVDTAQQLAESLKIFSDAIGGSALAGNITVGRERGIEFQGKSFGQDTEAFLDAAFRAVIENATTLESGLKDLLLAFDGTAEELGQFAAAVVSIRDQADINSITQAIEDFAAAGRGVYAVYNDTTDALKQQIAAFDGSLDSALSLNDALAANKTAAYEFATSILAIGKALQDVAEAQARDIRESVLTADELQRKRTKERDELARSLETLVDPAKVEEATRRILELNKQIFDSLSEDQQKVRAEEFATYAEKTSDVAQRVLDRTLEDARIAQEDMNTRIANLLGTAGAAQQQAANTQLQAANTMQSAVNDLRFGGITVNVNQTTGEVNVG